ncbi:DeoR/GlpR family DNA-binding transcription regulator [Lachnobacterium bovis]|uniref:Transcriptional regulator, DeoR family n=1 Tax=Lachnobacterium bovis TaxID=140626 RepID=A0A1H9STW3_9FIRM|nr:DeoR/GlpR family DNA-binding transcription regulator [Lachnobacterium bovis]SER88452.1 transcriptional regulator, DeoR family [Lachnobacterium bovis]
MLAEERFAKILSIIEREGSATITELMASLNASESTIRRDLNTLHSNGALIKVHGGAISNNVVVNTMDENYVNRSGLNKEDKSVIGKYAATLIKPNDFVYVDAGTTTSMMIDYITEKKVVFVTNAIEHARKLSQRGYTVYLLGGEMKISTEAIVGESAIESLNMYNFSIGFFGANGVSTVKGITTPELKEAMVKKSAISKCKRKILLADSSKFNEVSSVKFADFKEMSIITTNLKQQSLRKYKNITEVS